MTSVSNASSVGQLQITVAKKELEAVEQEGKNALELIHASMPEPAAAANAAPGVGGNVNYTA